MSNTHAIRLGFVGVLLVAIGVSSAFAAPASEAPVEAAAAEPEELPAGKYSTVTPKIYVTLSQYESETGNRITSFGEAPALAALVAAGELPPVADRLPDEPLVIEPLERIGTYGGGPQGPRQRSTRRRRRHQTSPRADVGPIRPEGDPSQHPAGIRVLRRLQCADLSPAQRHALE